MNGKTKIVIMVLCLFVAGLAMAAISAEPVAAKKFEDAGYTWEIQDDDWNHMVKVANDEYRHAESQGRAIPIGYSYKKNVTVTKDGNRYDGICFAVKNHDSVRSEVRGVTTEYLRDFETVSAK